MGSLSSCQRCVPLHDPMYPGGESAETILLGHGGLAEAHVAVVPPRPSAPPERALAAMGHDAEEVSSVTVPRPASIACTGLDRTVPTGSCKEVEFDTQITTLAEFEYNTQIPNQVEHAIAPDSFELEPALAKSCDCEESRRRVQELQEECNRLREQLAASQHVQGGGSLSGGENVVRKSEVEMQEPDLWLEQQHHCDQQEQRRQHQAFHEPGLACDHRQVSASIDMVTCQDAAGNLGDFELNAYVSMASGPSADAMETIRRIEFIGEEPLCALPSHHQPLTPELLSWAYAVLDLPDGSAEDIHKVVKRLALAVHPDKAGGGEWRERAASAFQRVQRAEEVLRWQEMAHMRSSHPSQEATAPSVGSDPAISRRQAQPRQGPQGSRGDSSAGATSAGTSAVGQHKLDSQDSSNCASFAVSNEYSACGACSSGGLRAQSSGLAPAGRQASGDSYALGGLSFVESKLKAKEWQFQLRMEMKQLDREIKKIQAEETKLRRQIAGQAQQGQTAEVQQLARAIVRSRKAGSRMEKTRQTMHAVNLQLTTAIATMSMRSSLQLSAEVMREMNGIVQAGGVGDAMENMRHEMARCADVQEQMEEVLHDADEDEEAATEVQRVLGEMELDRAMLLQSAAGSPLHIGARTRATASFARHAAPH